MNITMTNKEFNTKITLSIETIANDLIDMGITKREDIKQVITLTENEMNELMKTIRSK